MSVKIITNCSSNNKASIIAFGNFDGVHLGHQHIINKVNEISAKTGYKSAIVTFNPHPRKIFNPEGDEFQITNLEQRISIIGDYGIDLLYSINFTEQFAKMTPESFIKDFLVKNCNAKNIVLGNECSFGKDKLGDVNLLEKLSNVYGYKVIKSGFIKANGILCSSSKIREFLKSGEMKKAKELLGRNFTIQSVVEQGSRRGRDIGFPTINISLSQYIKPKFGVYCARVNIGKNYHFGVVNIGTRPTFEKNQKIILEMHIFDFYQELYGQQVSIELLDFLRSEKQFKNEKDLKEQIKCDISIAKRNLRC